MNLKSVLTILFVVLSVGAVSADDTEFRGLWVHNWRDGLLSPAQTDDTVRWAKDCNYNALIVQVRRVGDAYYCTNKEPRGSNIKGGDDFDPLAYAIKKGRENGMEVHAWFNVYRICTSTTMPADSRHPALAHPEWLSKDVTGTTMSPDGQFLDPGLPEVREYLADLAGDIAKNYDIDGFMLDYIRYPGRKWGYNDKAVAIFNAKYGRTGKPAPEDPQWSQWRRDQVTETVKAIRKELEQARPGIPLSASTIAWGPCPSDFSKTDAYTSVFQDWRGWMQNGLLDANIPMNYKDPANATQNKYYADWVAGIKRWSFGRHSYSGVMVYKDNVTGAAAQVKLAHDKGLDGSVGFAFSQLECRDKLASALKSKAYTKSAAIPTMSWLPKRTARSEQ